mgnify:CR=1 FL=1
MVGSSRRRWIWITLVALAAAALLWAEAHEPDAPETQSATTDSAPARPSASTASTLSPEAPEEADELDPPPPSPDAPPTATPLPRGEVELPPSAQALDGGVPERDPASTAERRDDMMAAVLERLNEDLRAAEEAGDAERAEQLRVRIERLEDRRRELTEP